MQFLLLLAGLILLLAGSSWFTGAAAVGVVCLAVFAAITVVQIVAFWAVASKAKRSFDRADPFGRRPPPRF